MLSNANTFTKCGLSDEGDCARITDSDSLMWVYVALSSFWRSVIDVPAVGVREPECAMDVATPFATPHRSAAVTVDFGAALAPDATAPSSVSASRNGTNLMRPPSTFDPSNARSSIVRHSSPQRNATPRSGRAARGSCGAEGGGDTARRAA